MSEAIYENPDGSHYTLNKDLLGNKRNEKKPIGIVRTEYDGTRRCGCAWPYAESLIPVNL